MKEIINEYGEMVIEIATIIILTNAFIKIVQVLVF